MEIVKFVEHGAQKSTPAFAAKFRQQLPALKFKLAEIDPARFPHLPLQLAFLADLYEDVMDGRYTELSYGAFGEALFALCYALKAVDIIPDSVPELGYADDSGVVRAVLIRHEESLARYALHKKHRWADITTEP